MGKQLSAAWSSLPTLFLRCRLFPPVIYGLKPGEGGVAVSLIGKLAPFLCF